LNVKTGGLTASRFGIEHQEDHKRKENAMAKPACKYCGKEGMNWAKVNDRWRLADEDGSIHNCQSVAIKNYIMIQATQKEAEILMFAIEETMIMLKPGSNNYNYLTSLKNKIIEWKDEGE
jgi:hypothetical protein